MDVWLWQSTTPDKAAVSEHSEDKATPRRSSPGGSTTRPSSSSSLLSSSAERRLAGIPSPTKSSPGRRVQSSAAKRLQYTSSQGSENGNGNSCPSQMQALTTAMQRSPLRIPRQNGISNCSDVNNVARNGSSEVNGRSLEVSRKSTSSAKSPAVPNKSPKLTATRSPKVVMSRSPKVTSRSPEVNGSPTRRRQLSAGSSGGFKRSSLESPAGQPKTKKFIVERLRNAKTSRKRTADAAATTGSKPSPSRKSPHRKSPGESEAMFT